MPLLLWGSIVARVHDNLDSEVVYSAVIGRFWAGGADNMAFQVFLGGVLDWTAFARVLHPVTLLYAVFPPVLAYAITEAIVIVLLYVGFRALLAALDLPFSSVLACLAAFGVSYPSYGLGLAGAPLLLALIFAKGPVRWWEWAIAVLLGVNSAFAVHALFMPIAVVVIALMVGRHPALTRAIGLLGLYLSTSLLAASSLIVAVLSGIPTFREEWIKVPAEAPLTELVVETLENLVVLDSAYFAVITPALHVSFVFIAAFLAGKRRAALVIIGIILLAEAADLAVPYILELGGPLASIGWYRFIWFVPFFVIVLAAMVQSRMVRIATQVSLALYVLAGIGIVPSILKSALPKEQVAEIRATLRTEGKAAAFRQAMAALPGVDLSNLARGVETWDNHTRPDAYACLRSALANERAGRVISHGVDPMLAPLHGIAAIDGYHNYYPLAYKHAFRPIIAAQLEADPALATYFDNWGGRVGTLANRAIVPAPINWSAAADLGATHVIADRAIDGLELTTTCEDLRLYRIAP